MDARIILAGQPVDLVGAMRQGNAAAIETNALRQNNQLTDLYRQQGAGLLAGDQGAMNALAGVDPGLAMGFKADQQAYAQNNRKMEILNAEEKRVIEDRAAAMSAAERTAAAAELESNVAMGMAIPDEATWDQTMGQVAPELVGQFGNRQALAFKYMSVADAFKNSQSPDPTEGAPANYMWIDPNNRGAGVVPLPGIETKPADNQAERDISLLGEIGIPRDEAIRITQLYTISKDPMTGEQVLVDKSTGRAVDGGQPAPTAPASSAPTAPPAASGLAFGEQYTQAPSVFGWEGMLKRGANAVTDVIPGLGTAFPTEQQTLMDFRVLSENLVNDIASAYPRQPPSWLLENIAELTPKAGTLWEGPDSAASKLQSLGASMESELRLAETQLSTRISPERRQELELRKAGIESALNRLSKALGALRPEAQQGGNKTSSGVTWSIE